MAQGGRGLGGAQIDRLGDQKALRLDQSGLDPLAQLLVKDPLVQGVLVDDRDTLAGFGHQVAVVDLQGLRGRPMAAAVGATSLAAASPRPRPANAPAANPDATIATSAVGRGATHAD